MAQIRLRSKRSMSPNPFILAVTMFSGLARAGLSLQELQAIAQFPPDCEAAYQTPIQQCPDASAFSAQGGIFSPSGCGKSCFFALNSASAAIQAACQGTSAPPGTVIAHAFTGDLSVFLCSGATASSSESSGNPMSTSSPDASSAPTEGPTPTDSQSQSTTSSLDSSSDVPSSSSSSESVPESTQTTATSTSTESVSSSSDSSSSPTSISSPSSTATQASSSTSSKTSSSKSSSQTLFPDGGGSPFDQVVPNSGISTTVSRNILTTITGVLIAVVVAFKF